MTKLNPLVSADIALFSIGESRLQVLLVRRANEPERGRLALPGAMLKPDEDADLEATARRTLRLKLGIEVPHLEQVRTFAGIGRDPRGWSVSVLHVALLPRDQVPALPQRKVEEVVWVDADAAGLGLAFDHDEQLAVARAELRRRVAEHALPLHLMPEQFTLTQLQATCEIILGAGPGQAVTLDKGAFRRRFADTADIVKIEGAFERGAQRPAQLFTKAATFRF
jgi:8-oxo-dGTP diphosphatase